ncbi:MAG: S41 family peptidase [Pseudomonadales bacterium]
MNKFFSAFLLIFFSSLAFLPMVFAQEPEYASSEEAEPIPPRFSLEEFQQFARIFEQVRQNYVEDFSDAELLDMAIEGMLSRLDPHSQLLNQEERELVEDTSEGIFYGVGLELTMREGELMVVTPLDNSPAQRAGMEAGDIIIEVDGQSLWGLSLSESLEIIDGDPGSEITILVVRDDQPKPFEVSLSREKITMESVYTKTVTEDIGYIRIRQFQRNSGEEFSNKLQSLLDDHPYITGLILDLRNNPGGVLPAAIEISDAFISEGLIVSTRGRSANSNLEFFASRETLAPDIPLVVLINQGSASASEIVAGALQDHKRAIIIGDISFGKGSVQNVVPIDDNRSIKLTTARYYTPSGRSIQAQGIFPDISVLDGEIIYQNTGVKISEADLFDHLENENDDAPQLLGFRETLSDIEDLQLAQALAFLKGLAIYQR